MPLALEPSSALASLLVPVEILFINLLLSADNALVIAMACRGLPATDIRRATMLGIVGAIVLRLALGSVAIVLLRVPLLQMVAGAVLLWIAVRLTLIGDDGHGAEDRGDGFAAPAAPEREFFAAVGAIIFADVAMSIDNVVAISAIAQGSVVYIAIGLALSIPMLIWGSDLIREFLDGRAILLLLAGAFLGWVAGAVAVADPIVAESIALNAPALQFAVPVVCAVFVIWQNFILDPRRTRPRGSHAK